jgi:hypothetical protein
LLIGTAEFANREFWVPLDSIQSIAEARDYANAEVIGILGMDLLASADVELDVANRKMNLYARDHCPDNVVYWSKVYNSLPIRFGPRGEFTFPMELDGKKIEATLSLSITHIFEG